MSFIQQVSYHPRCTTLYQPHALRTHWYLYIGLTLADSILTGNILNKRRFDRETQLYLESIKVNDLSRLNRIKPTLLLEEYYNFWKKKRESTVTSPFRLHVGHYKAATLNLKILEVHRRLLLIPFQTGLVPKRWRRTVQTMLEKDTGAPWIHRLRIIELYSMHRQMPTFKFLLAVKR